MNAAPPRESERESETASPRSEVLRTFAFDEAGSSLALRRRGDAWELVLVRTRGGAAERSVVLLSSAALETERAFGELAATLGARRVLVGGLGFGATVAGVLDAVGAAAEVVVVEKLGVVADLVRGELAHLARGVGGGASVLDDPRVTLVHADVGATIAAAASAERPFDAILLDVDNGPDWASFRTNAAIYADVGLAHARAALVPGGALAVWSGYAADKFVARLRGAGFTPSIVPLRERGVVRARAYVGVRPASAAHG